MIVTLVILILAVLLVLLFNGPVIEKAAKVGGMFALLQALLAIVKWLIGAA